MTSRPSPINSSMLHAPPDPRALAPQDVLVAFVENGLQFMARVQKATLGTALQLNTEALESNQRWLGSPPLLLPFEWFELAVERYVGFEADLFRLVLKQTQVVMDFMIPFRSSFAARSSASADPDPASVEKAMDTVIGDQVVTGVQEVKREGERNPEKNQGMGHAA